MTRLSRRDLLAALLGAPGLMLTGCSRPDLPIEGEMFAPSFDIGHRIRDGYRPQATSADRKDIGVVIVGGGIAGLSAAWRLKQAGCEDFVLLELEAEEGGTARSGSSPLVPYPWGAHYVTVPMAENRALIRLLDEMGTIEKITDDGSPVVAEQFLCRDPHERLFYQGKWIEGVYPFPNASDDDLKQKAAFRAEIDRYASTTDQLGRRMFAIPMASGSNETEVTSLDNETMEQWMQRRGWDSARLHWFVDYACRDDYGLRANQTSAWAGIYYFAARIRGLGDELQPVITWPEGNGRVVRHLSDMIGERLCRGHAVTEVLPPETEHPEAKTSVVAVDTSDNRIVEFSASQVIFAAPQFLANHLINGLSATRDLSEFQYGSWLVANIHLKERPSSNGFPLSWDNVIHGSRSLGYVVATHQRGLDFGPTILTWYYPFCDQLPSSAREQLLEFGWKEWADVVLTDLEMAHPEIRSLVTRLDLMRWGHAMIRPTPGFVWSESRQAAVCPFRSVHFAGTDLSGIPLMEEAFFHGVRAAEGVLSARQTGFETWL